MRELKTHRISINIVTNVPAPKFPYNPTWTVPTPGSPPIRHGPVPLLDRSHPTWIVSAPGPPPTIRRLPFPLLDPLSSDMDRSRSWTPSHPTWTVPAPGPPLIRRRPFPLLDPLSSDVDRSRSWTPSHPTWTVPDPEPLPSDVDVGVSTNASNTQLVRCTWFQV